jgi:hypothetical protein
MVGFECRQVTVDQIRRAEVRPTDRLLKKAGGWFHALRVHHAALFVNII